MMVPEANAHEMIHVGNVSYYYHVDKDNIFRRRIVMYRETLYLGNFLVYTQGCHLGVPLAPWVTYDLISVVSIEETEDCPTSGLIDAMMVLEDL